MRTKDVVCCKGGERTTPTPCGWSAPSSASAICLVSRSWTCRAKSDFTNLRLVTLQQEDQSGGLRMSRFRTPDGETRFAGSRARELASASSRECEQPPAPRDSKWGPDLEAAGVHLGDAHELGEPDHL